MFEVDTYRVRVEFTTEVLGSTPKDQEVYTAYIAGKAALTDEQLKAELAAVDVVEEKGWTGFLRIGKDKETPALSAHVLKGFMKSACGMARLVKGTQSAKIRAYKKIIDGAVWVVPQFVPLHLPAGAHMSVNERPLRASTPQGERIALARSDSLPPGTWFECDISILGGLIPEKTLLEWFWLGLKFEGIGQWRGSGNKGRFMFSLAHIGTDKIIPAVTL